MTVDPAFAGELIESLGKAWKDVEGRRVCVAEVREKR
jgi:hypothetical protein